MCACGVGVCKFMCICTCMCECMSLCACVFEFVYVRVCECMHVCVHECVCVSVCVCVLGVPAFLQVAISPSKQPPGSSLLPPGSAPPWGRAGHTAWWAWEELQPWPNKPSTASVGALAGLESFQLQPQRQCDFRFHSGSRSS